jgi:glycine/D-amino acid oxidase-like deaminating enzyme
VQTADIVVIGAGINGASTAYNLAKRGAKRVLLLERYVVASGGTGKSAAVIRQHYSNPELVRMVRRSVEVFAHFDQAIGGDCGFVPCGWAFLVPPYASEGFAHNLEMQRGLGVDTREITREDLLEIEPRLRLDGVDRIAYEPGSGYADPHATTCAYVARFRDLGGEVRQMTAVSGLIVEGGAVRGVRTATGDISAGAVVDAAGPWAHHVARWAGVDLPIRVTREEEIVFETAMAGGPPRLVFSDMAEAIYYRPDGRTRTLLGRGYPKEYEYVDPDHFREEVDHSFLEEASERLIRRLPAFERALMVRAYTGLYDVTPDWHPVLGRVDGLDGFYLCAGFSGHGFKIGPAVGEVMAEEILDGAARSVDIARLRFDRFATNALLGAAYGANRA